MRKLLLFALSICILSGCGKEPKEIIDEEHQVVLTFSAQDNEDASLKSVGSAAERSITKLLLFGVNEANNVVKYPVINNPVSGTTSVTISKTIKTIYAIANPTTALEGASPATLTALNDLVGSYTAQPTSSFLMSGSASVTGSSVNFTLVRAIAKIKINAKNDFVITSVTVQNTPRDVYVFPRSPFAVPTNRINYGIVNSATPELYVTENTAANSTKFLVVGTYLDKTANYTFELKVGGNPIDILRNRFYTVDITPLTETECFVSFSVVDWVDVTTDEQVIPDSAF